MVRMKGLEPSRPEALAPKASVSTNSTTSAYVEITLVLYQISDIKGSIKMVRRLAAFLF
jgi:hypothetical protein